MSNSQIPVIDVSPFLEPRTGAEDPRLRSAVADLSEALRETGFFYVKGHGVPRPHQQELLDVFRNFFSEPLDEKMRIAMPRAGRAWRGYFPPEGELTSGRPDRKEGIYFGREEGPSSARVQAGLPLHGANQWPPGEAHARMKPAVLEHLRLMTELGQTLIGAIALGLGLERDYFRTRFTDEPTILFRAFNYAEHVWTKGEDEWGVREHTDYGILTILLQDDSGGLQVKTKTGEWIGAPPIDDTFVINIGDMLEVWTHGIYRATPHRVRNKARGQRISLPFFFDPNWHSTLEPISRALLAPDALAKVGRERAARWDGLNLGSLSREMTYGEFLWNKVSKVFPDLA